MEFVLFRVGRVLLSSLSVPFVIAIGLLFSHPVSAQQESGTADGSAIRAESSSLWGRNSEDRYRAVNAQTLGVVVNVQDPQSVALARVYMRERKIDSANLIAVSFSPRDSIVSPEAFSAIYRQTIEPLGDRIQALVLTWSRPYRVGCMSVTSAFAFGFNEAYCATGCQLTKASQYFDSTEQAPYTHHQMRPTMMLAGHSFDAAIDLISRGLLADGSQPQQATGYVVETADAVRSTRSLGHEPGSTRAAGVSGVQLKYMKAPALRGQKNVLAYFTGAAHVPSMAENQYLPGAVGDHLTSFGGVLDGSAGQMSVLQWIKYGLTGSYGTVVEPCNFPQKFPDPEVFLDRYVSGDSLVEAYWKSVEMPGQGLFVGEPLARPFVSP